jgi:hypothetical protein
MSSGDEAWEFTAACGFDRIFQFAGLDSRWWRPTTVKPAARHLGRGRSAARALAVTTVDKQLIELLPAGGGRSARGSMDYLWKMMISPSIVAALISQGADLCHGWTVFGSTVAASFFSSVGMFKSGLLQKKMRAKCDLVRLGMM